MGKRNGETVCIVDGEGPTSGKGAAVGVRCVAKEDDAP